jgi:hypothetical protein
LFVRVPTPDGLGQCTVQPRLTNPQCRFLYLSRAYNHHFFYLSFLPLLQISAEQREVERSLDHVLFLGNSRALLGRLSPDRPLISQQLIHPISILLINTYLYSYYDFTLHKRQSFMHGQAIRRQWRSWARCRIPATPHVWRS